MLSCNNNSTTPLNATQLTVAKDSTALLMDSIAQDITHDGPTAWLKYFENTPTFFMAADGQLAFANNDSATNFIRHILAKNIKAITLRWNNVRIDPLTASLASIGADYHEDITDFSSKTTPYEGYFTAIAEQTPQGWKLRNLHWSQKAK
jgi:hypothetical protein